MEAITEKLKKIDSAVEKLTNALLHSKTENNNFKNQIRELNTTIAGQKEDMVKLQEQLKLLKVSRSVETGKGSYEAKVKINELVREIDKCIGLLNS